MTSAPAWTSLPPIEQYRQWKKTAPEIAERMWLEVQREARHSRAMDRWEVVLRALLIVAGFATVVVLAWVAKYYVDHHAPTQGASVFGAGAAGLVGVFVTSMALVSRRQSRKATEAPAWQVTSLAGQPPNWPRTAAPDESTGE